jgi:uncharacterized protein with HEPN domain
MKRDARAFLWDARESADAIAEFVIGRTEADYRADRMLRAAVERHFEIIGEALRQVSRVAPALAARIPELAQAVAFRNRLIHGYDTVDDTTVWHTAQTDLPRLRDRVDALLAESGPDG